MATEKSEAAAAQPTESASQDDIVRIKKYANRRLYNTATSTYVTLDHLAQMVKEGTEFIVQDAKTGEDITRAVLTQIIVEEEAKGQNLLPISFLRQLIGFYGDNLQSLVPRYLENSMQMFARNQEQFRDAMKGALGGFFPFSPQLDELSRQNLAMFQNAMMQMLAPFARDGGGPQSSPPPSAAQPAADKGFDDLKRQLDAMQRKLDELSKK